MSQNTQRKNLGQTAWNAWTACYFLSLATHSNTGKEQPKDEVTLGHPQQKNTHLSFHHDQISPLTAFPNFIKSRMPLSFNEPSEQMIITKPEARLGLIYLSRIFHTFSYVSCPTTNPTTDSALQDPSLLTTETVETLRFALDHFLTQVLEYSKQTYV